MTCSTGRSPFLLPVPLKGPLPFKELTQATRHCYRTKLSASRMVRRLDGNVGKYTIAFIISHFELCILLHDMLSALKF
jgi:hypothetical protein